MLKLIPEGTRLFSARALGDYEDTLCVGAFHTFVQNIRVFACFFAFGWWGVHGEGGKGDRVNPIPSMGLTLRPRVDGFLVEHRTP